MRRVAGTMIGLALAAACTGPAEPEPTPAATSSSPLISSPSPPPHVPDLHHISVVSPRAVWAITGRKVFVTLDGGDTWTERTPPGGAAVVGMFTLDGSYGWVGLAAAGGRRVFVARTSDAGRTWDASRVRHHSRGIEEVAFSFIDGRRGWASISAARGRGPFLFRTRDGGAHWTRACPACQVSGPIVFASPEHGWSLDEDALLATRNGGRTWREVPGGAPRPSSGRGVRIEALPVFVSDRVGILFATVSRTTATSVISTTVSFFVSRDGGRWMPATPLSLHGLPSYVTTGVPADVISGEDWVVASPAGLYETHDGGKTWGLQLPDVSFDGVSEVDFATEETGWVLVTDGRCPPGTAICRREPRLFRTTDGGRHWDPDGPGVAP